ncbi:MAG: methyltransferase domain-containing protein [Planctomycetes bacterium]|nr:methyltransferase domain-containing protein [Planctomycetota bacterium]
MPAVPADPWFVEAFREGYVRLYPHRDLSAARREAGFLVAQGLRGRVLDLCCGFGRHTLAMRESGIDAVGIDLSPELLAHAAGSPGWERLRGRILRGDARTLPFAGASFGSVVNLFSSFGYFGEEGDKRVLLEIARVLAPGGFLAMDLMNPAFVRARLVPFSRTERGGARLVESRSLQAGGRLVVKDVELQNESGTLRWREEVRLYEPEELLRWLDAAGFRQRAAFGDFDGSPLGESSPRQLVMSQRI